MKKIVPIFFATTSILMSGCSTLLGGTASSEEAKLQLNAHNGGTIDCTALVYQDYLQLTEETEIAKLLWEANNRGVTKPVVKTQSVILSWERGTASYSRYRMWVSKTEDFRQIVHQAETMDSFVAIDGLLPGTYYWKVQDGSGKESEVDSFVISNYVRSLDVDQIRNFRDIGGWKTEDGKTLKYGLSYRCGALKESSGKALSALGVQTEIDLRAGEEYAQSVISSGYGIRFLQAGIMQGDYVLKDKSFYSMLTPEQIEEKRHSEAAFKQEYADALYEAFKLYTDEANYPILFHCTAGADRTGTFAFLLEGMLGVELDDLYRDFELTSFSMGGKRWRSNIERDAQGGYFFNDDGYVTVSDNYVAIGLLYKGLMTCYSTGDGKLSSAIKNYLRTDVGLTDEDFAAIANIMLE